MRPLTSLPVIGPACRARDRFRSSNSSLSNWSKDGQTMVKQWSRVAAARPTRATGGGGQRPPRFTTRHGVVSRRFGTWFWNQSRNIASLRNRVSEPVTESRLASEPRFGTSDGISRRFGTWFRNQSRNLASLRNRVSEPVTENRPASEPLRQVLSENEINLRELRQVCVWGCL